MCIRNVMAIAALVLMSACANFGGVTSPVDQVATMVCKDGQSVVQLLEKDMKNFPDAKVYINKVLVGKDAVDFLLNIPSTPGSIDTVVIMSAHAYPGSEGVSRIVAVKNGCVVGSLMLSNDEVASMLGITAEELVPTT